MHSFQYEDAEAQFVAITKSERFFDYVLKKAIKG